MGICRRKLPESGRGPSDSLQGLNGLCTATSTYQDGIPISLPGIKVFFRRLASQLYIFYFIRAIYRRRRSRSRKWDFTCLRTPPNKINHSRTGANKQDTRTRDKQGQTRWELPAHVRTSNMQSPQDKLGTGTGMGTGISSTSTVNQIYRQFLTRTPKMIKG